MELLIFVGGTVIVGCGHICDAFLYGVKGVVFRCF